MRKTPVKDCELSIFAKIVGALEVVIALAVMVLGVSMAIDFIGDEVFAGEWAVMLVAIDFAVAATFGIAGYTLLRHGPASWKYQWLPLVAVTLIGLYLVNADGF